MPGAAKTPNENPGVQDRIRQTTVSVLDLVNDDAIAAQHGRTLIRLWVSVKRGILDKNDHVHRVQCRCRTSVNKVPTHVAIRRVVIRILQCRLPPALLTIRSLH